MRFARPAPSSHGTPLAPLLDVVLLLLIFFVVTSSFATPTLELELPEAEGRSSTRASALVIAVDATGEIAIEGRPTTLDALESRLREAKAQARPVELRADRATDHEHVVAVLDRAQSVGVVSLAIAVGEASPRSLSAGAATQSQSTKGRVSETSEGTSGR